jgi:isoleucyl-tRNA synthetase
MKANLPQREPSILKKWEEVNLYQSLLQKNKGKEKFILHDGPPYANGDIHIGHALNKVLKDVIVRYHFMKGFYSPYVPGWDCHGQPIEYEVEKRVGVEKWRISQSDFRKKCEEYANYYIERQREEFKRLGVIGDWDSPYLTLQYEYEATDVEIFGELYEKGLIYQGEKPIYWCYRCQTALAEAEIEYREKSSPSIIVKFPFLENPWSLKDTYLLIWTTTPWTLPANVAVALHPEALYLLVKTDDENYVLSKSLVNSVFESYSVVKEFKSSNLEGKEVTHPLYKDKRSKIVLADFVSLEQGTGCVHIAPGHGEEDYKLGQKYELPLVMPVNDEGKFTKKAGKYEGLIVDEANSVILNDLEKSDYLLYSGKISHSYPHCWRCKKPVIFRATRQWFISMEKGDFKRKALKAVSEVKWYPDWSINRISSMLEERPDWCISRQRFWGVPLPVFYCLSCEKPIVTKESIKAVAELFRREGSNSWFMKEAQEILPSNFSCPFCKGKDFQKETDILDVWFESGVSHFAVLEKREELSWPASLYLEGSDQHRGWFQSSLLTSVGVREEAPYEAVLTHGFIVDEEGRKMSKSLGNVVDPLEVVKEMGADVIRLWVVSSDYSSDIAVSPEILKRVAEAYRRIRNTFRFLLGNLYDFRVKDAISYEELEEIDKWALHRLQEVIETTRRNYEEFRFHLVFKEIHNFCSNDLSAFYLDVLKDRLYTEAPFSRKRKSAQSALVEILLALCKLLAPILVFTTDEVWNYVPEEWKGNLESVHLSDLPEAKKEFLNYPLAEKWGKILTIRKVVLKSLEEAREKKVIGDSLEAKVVLTPSSESEKDFLEGILPLLPDVFVVSQVGLSLPSSVEEVGVEVERASGLKCPRCWKYTQDIGSVKGYEEVCARCARVMQKVRRKGGS